MESNQNKINPAKRTRLVNEYYFSQKLREIDNLRATGREIINLGIGSPDLAPSPQTIAELTKTSVNDNVHGYQSYQGIKPLRDAFSGWYKKFFNVSLDSDSEILPLIGSKEGIMHISMAFLDDGEKVLVPDPGYPTYTSATLLSGGIVNKYKLRREGSWYPHFDEIEGNGLTNVKIMWVNYPHMPTGQRAEIKVFEKIVAFAHKHKILICNDNPYSFILNDKPLSILSVDGAKDVALELNSLSKSHNMPGWRIGMVAGDKEYINCILKVKSNMDSGMFKPLQLAAAVALNSGDEWYFELNETYKRRRALAEEMMKRWKCSFDNKQTGLFVWGEIPGDFKSGEEFSDHMLYNYGIFITPGSVFGIQGERYIRVSLCCNEDTLEKCLSIIN